MTISTTIIKSSANGNGSTSAFTYSFKITDDDDIQVIIRSATGTETVKSKGTHYNVSGVGNNSGTVTFTSGNIPANGETVVLRRSTPQTQAMDLIDNDPMSAETIETAHDKSIAVTQELQEQVDRSLKLSRTNTMTSTEFTVDATNRANKVLAFDNSGEIAVTQELGTFKGNWAASTSYAVRDLVKDTSTNNIFIAITAHTSSGSQPLTTNTDSAKWSLIVDAATATTSSTSASNSATAASNSATAAASSASTASTQASNASTSASTASTQATNAANSATASANSATASANSASAAAATFDLFDDAFLGSKSSNPSVDNDGNALQDGALYFDTTNDVMKVYNVSNTSWLQLTPTVSNQNNINSAVANASNINAAVANASNINAAVSNASNINSAVSNASNINTVAGISTAITNVNNNSSNINSVNANSANINLTAGSITNVNNVGGSIASVNSAAANLASINNFGEVYRIASSAPSSSLNAGDLYFDTSTNILNVYGASGWQNAGSSVNGTSDRFKYVASGTPTTFSGSDANGNTLSFDANFIDVYLNGIKMVNGTDVNVSSGSSIVFASAVTNGDIIEAVAFGTFSVANMNASNLTSGTVPSARVSGAYTGITQTGTLTSFTSTGIDDNATSTAITIDSSERVGLGRTPTNAPFEVAAPAGQLLRFVGNNSQSNYMRSGWYKSDNSTNLAFLNVDGDVQFTFGTTSATPIKIYSNNSERVRLDASGNFMVGTTDNTMYNNTSGGGLCYRPSLSLDIARQATSSGNYMLSLNNTGVDAKFINFTKDGTGVGSIASMSGANIQIGSGDVGLRFFNTGDAIYPVNNGTSLDRDNAIDLGRSGVRFKDLYLSGGAFIGGTGSANKLEDYEEGTWTPTLTTGTSAQDLKYTKIGNVVHISGSISFSSVSGSGIIEIGGLPFTSTSHTESYTALNSYAYKGLDMGDSHQFQTLRVNLNSTNMRIIAPKGDGQVRAFGDHSQVTGGYFLFRVGGFYITN